MNGGIFLLQDSGELVKMSERQYEAEAVLQTLLAKYPDLLAGDQIDIAAPRRWLLITQEAAVPSEEGGTGRWALDHLFLDQDAVPTIVEVKRSSDTRIRREVVGQMLDYAANAVVYWPAESMRAHFEAGCEAKGRGPAEVLTDFLGAETDHEGFWASAKRNLQAGKVRLVFVADEIPHELRRVVEFLNGQMDPAEVLAIEVKQYVGQDRTALVPRVVGQTVAAQRAKSVPARAGRQWDEASFLQDLGQRRGDAAMLVAKRILDWAREAGLRVAWGRGGQDGSFYPMLDFRGTPYWTISVWTYGRLEIQFEYMRKWPPFSDEVERWELVRRLNEIPDVNIPNDAINRRPSISLDAFQNEVILQQFIAILDWIVNEHKTVAS